MLLGRDLVQLQHFALFDQRQRSFSFLILFCLLVPAFLVDFEKTVKLLDRSRGPEKETPGIDIYGGLIEDRGHHLRSNESLPDQTVKLQFVLAEIFLQRIRSVANVCWSNRFVGILREAIRPTDNR